MQTIYEPKGRAREYSELALNLYRGCSHGCTYCYVPKLLHMTRKDFINPQLRKGIIEALKKDAPKYSGREVLLCFICDPYQPLEIIECLTLETILILHKNNISVRILTKGGQRSMRDFHLLNSKDFYGATLTFISDTMTKIYEPFAEPYISREHALKEAHRIGIPTWVSLEPVIYTTHTLEIIKRTHSFVDEYKVGKLNYTKIDIDWAKFLKDAKELFKKYNKKYYIKKDLAVYEIL